MKQGRWFLAVVLIALALTVAHAAYRETLPSDGWFISGNVQGNLVTQNLSGRPSPLRSGDVLVAIDGYPVPTIADDWFVQPPIHLTFSSNGPQRLYTVRRDGQPLTVPVTLGSESPWALIGSFVVEGVDGIVLILIEILLVAVYCTRPKNPATRVALVLITGALIARIVHAPSGTIPREILLAPFALYPTRILEEANPLIVLPSLIFLFLVFPAREGPVQRHPQLALLAVYLPMPLLYFATWLHPTNARWTFVIVAGLELVATLGVVVGIIVRSNRTIRSPVARAQLHWMTLGFVVGFGGYTGSFWAESLVTRLTPVLELARALSLPVLPLAFVVALLFYRLFDIDVIINRALVYALVTIALTFAFNASVWLLERLSSAFLGGDHDVTLVLSTLAIAALFFPIRRAAQVIVDRRFYRQKYDAARTLGAFGASIRDEVDLAAVSERLVGVARETMQPTTVSIWIKPPSR